MAGPYELAYRSEVIDEDLAGIPRNMQRRIVTAIEERLGTRPDQYGKRLSRSLRGLWKMRVGDYRVVYAIEGTVVRIWIVAHRRRVYAAAALRWGRGGGPG